MPILQVMLPVSAVLSSGLTIYWPTQQSCTMTNDASMHCRSLSGSTASTSSSHASQDSAIAALSTPASAVLASSSNGTAPHTTCASSSSGTPQPHWQAGGVGVSHLPAAHPTHSMLQPVMAATCRGLQHATCMPCTSLALQVLPYCAHAAAMWTETVCVGPKKVLMLQTSSITAVAVGLAPQTPH